MKGDASQSNIFEMQPRDRHERKTTDNNFHLPYNIDLSKSIRTAYYADISHSSIHNSSL